MLALHTTFRNLVSVISYIVILHASCSEKPTKNLAIIKALDESLSNSNKLLFVSTTDYMVSLKAKLSDHSTYLRASIWYPKAERIQNLSANIYNYIESIKTELSGKSIKESDIDAVSRFFDDVSYQLYDRLLKFKKKILEVDTLIALKFQNSLVVFTRSNEPTTNSKDNLAKIFFSNSSVSAASAMLVRLQNNIRTVELNMVGFCHEQCGKVTIGPCIVDWPIVGLSSGVVQSGEKIEITAGVGSFYSDIDPEVFIYNKKIPLKEDALAVYRLRAASQPGKYYVPIKFIYTDQDGKRQTVQKEIEYTVANIQKQ